jgi:hypothetical protein
MSVIFVVGLGKSAWTGILTIAPVVVVAALLLWFFATGKVRR